MPDDEQPDAVAEETLAAALDMGAAAEQPEGAVGDSDEPVSPPATEVVAAAEEEFDLTVGGKTQRVPRSKMAEYAQKGLSYEQKMAELKTREAELADIRGFRDAIARLEATDPDAAKEVAERIQAAWSRQNAPLPPEVLELVEGNRRAKADTEHKAAFGRAMTDEEYSEVADVAKNRRVPVADAWVLAFGKKALAQARKAGETEAVTRLKAGQSATGASAARGASPPPKAKSDADFFADMGAALQRSERGSEE